MILENNRAKLTLLTLNNFKELTSIANQEHIIFYSPSDISTPEKYKAYVEIALAEYENKKAIPFIIYDKKFKTYAGSTRFGLINYTDKVLHIGWTWLGKAFQGTGLNKNIKYLMLKYAFENMNFEKVEFRIDERNLKSRKAVEKIGGVFEGILRENKIMSDGFRRSTCCYGILKREWHSLKNDLFLNCN